MIRVLKDKGQETSHAAEGLNISGGKYLLEIAALDDQFKPDLTVTAVRRMLNGGIKIIGTLGGDTSMAALELTLDL